MNKIHSLLFVAATFVQTPHVEAAPTLHSSHDLQQGHVTSTIGTPGRIENVDRTIEIFVRETGSGDMLFDPDVVHIEHDTTIRFIVSNTGSLVHELVLGTFDEIEQRRQSFRRNPDLPHDVASAVKVPAGETAEIVWKFSSIMNLEYACLIPGHREAGMWGVIIVHDHLAPRSKS
ncbi:copper oxidase [Rhodobacteraceae bacterium M382]|nr:copper oxidase [Rhodobacteraceae bacterium M382]